MRSNRDLSHWRPATFNGYGNGGWWNFGGLLREVSVRRVDAVDIEKCRCCRACPSWQPAKVEVRAYLSNMTGKAREAIWSSPRTTPRRLVGKRSRDSPRLVTQLHDRAPRLWDVRPRCTRCVCPSRPPGRARRVRLQLRRARAQERPRQVILLDGHASRSRAPATTGRPHAGGALSSAARLLVSPGRPRGDGPRPLPAAPGRPQGIDRSGVLGWVTRPSTRYRTPASGSRGPYGGQARPSR